MIPFFISAGFITAIQNEMELQYKVIHQKISIPTMRNKYCLHIPSKNMYTCKGRERKVIFRTHDLAAKGHFKREGISTL